MTPLEAVRQLKFTPWEDSCHLTCESCGADGVGEDGPFPHEPNCPWRSMPRIVAALEAAEKVIQEKPSPHDLITMVPFGAYQELVAALRGKE